MRTAIRFLFSLCGLLATQSATAQCTMEGNLGRWPQQVAVVSSPTNNDSVFELVLGPGPYFTVLRESIVRTGSLIRVSGFPYYYGDVGLPPGNSGPYRASLGALLPGEYTIVLDFVGVDCSPIVRTFRVGAGAAATPIPTGRLAVAAIALVLMLSGLVVLRWRRTTRPAA